MPAIREFRSSDLEPTLDLFRASYAGPSLRPRDEVRRRFRRAFVEFPTSYPAVRSQVHVEDDGRVTGFVGVIACRFHDGAQTRCGAILSCDMVAPGCGTPDAATRLLRAALHQDQAFSYSDAVFSDNDTMIAAWIEAGGHHGWAHGVGWTLVLQPLEHERRRLLRDSDAGRRHLPKKALLHAGARLASGLDRLAGRRAEPSSRDRSLRVVDLDPRELLAQVQRASDPGAVRSDPTPEQASWYLDYCADYASRGSFFAHRVVSRGATVGWWTGYHRDRVAELVGLWADPGRWPEVLSQLLVVAQDQHAVSIEGHAHARDFCHLLDAGATPRTRDRRFYVHSSDDVLGRRIACGDCAFTGLESEEALAP